MAEGEFFFELFGNGDFIRLVPLNLIYLDADNDWDKNWINTKVIIKGGSFAGSYEAELMTVDFERFKRQFAMLYDNLNGTAKFVSIEDYLEMIIKGDGLGHFNASIRANDKGNINGVNLRFTLSFDQTTIKKMVNQLNTITDRFPVVGDLKI